MNDGNHSVLPVSVGNAPAMDAGRSVSRAVEAGGEPDQAWARALQAATPKRPADAEPSASQSPDSEVLEEGPEVRAPDTQDSLSQARRWTGPPGPDVSISNQRPALNRLAATSTDASPALDPMEPVPASPMDPNPPVLGTVPETPEPADSLGTLRTFENETQRGSEQGASRADARLDSGAAHLRAAAQNAPRAAAGPEPVSTTGLQTSPRDSAAELVASPRAVLAKDDQSSGSVPATAAGTLPIEPEEGLGPPEPNGLAASGDTSQRGSGVPEGKAGLNPAADSLNGTTSAGAPTAPDGALGATANRSDAPVPASTVRSEPSPAAALAQATGTEARPATRDAAVPATTPSSATAVESQQPATAQGPRRNARLAATLQTQQLESESLAQGRASGTSDPDQLLRALARDAATAFELKPGTAGSSSLQSLALAPAATASAGAALEGPGVSPASLNGTAPAPATASAQASAQASASVAASPQQLALALGNARELGQELGRLLSRGQLDGQRSFSVTLYPEELGRLDIRVASAGEQSVAVTIAAQQPQVRDLLEAQVGRLRAALSEGGFAEVDVDLGERADDRSAPQQRDSEQEFGSARHAATPGTITERALGNELPLDPLAAAANRQAPGFNAYA